MTADGLRKIPHGRWLAVDTQRHINNGTYPLFFAYILQRRDWGRHTPLFLGRLRLSFFRGVRSPCFVGGAFSLCPFRFVFCPFLARFRCGWVFGRRCGFRSFLGGLTAFFWALRIRQPLRRRPACRFWRFRFPLFRFRSGVIPSAWIT